MAGCAQANKDDRYLRVSWPEQAQMIFGQNCIICVVRFGGHGPSKRYLLASAWQCARVPIIRSPPDLARFVAVLAAVNEETIARNNQVPIHIK
jgi:hypothetical protein